MSREIQKHVNGVSVLASTTADISTSFTPPDNHELLLKVVLSQATMTNAVTFKVQDSYDNGETFSDIGDQAQGSLTKKTFAIGTNQVFTITFPSTAGATHADYLEFEMVGGDVAALWLNIDGNGQTPTGAAFMASTAPMLVDITTGDTAAQVAAKVVAQVGPFWTDFFTMVDNLDGTVTVTQALQGVVDDPVPHNEDDSGAGSISVVVDVEGGDGGVALVSNEITSTAHGFATGDRVCLAGNLPGPLVPGAYYVIKVNNDTLKFAQTKALALAGTAIDLTTSGSGTCSIIGAEIEIRMVEQDATDMAQLPLWGTCKVQATTGVGDLITVSKIYLAT